MREQAIRKIKTDLGSNVKFLMCVRDPILRPYSHWVHAQTRSYGEKYKELTFGKCIRDRDSNWSFIEGSSYGKHIRNFLKYYNKDDLYIMVNEEVKADPQKEYAKAFNWLGVDDKWSGYDCDSQINLSDYKKHGGILEEDRHFLKECFKYDTEEFYNFIGREVEAWEK